MVRSARPDLVYKAICAGTLGQVEWKPEAAENMRCNPRMKRFTPQGIRVLLREFVLEKGCDCIIPRPESDEYWLEMHPDDPWWYKVVIEEVEEFPQGLFVKMKLVDPDDELDPWVQIVDSHE
jgi:hypothetical protein